MHELNIVEGTKTFKTATYLVICLSGHDPLMDPGPDCRHAVAAGPPGMAIGDLPPSERIYRLYANDGDPALPGFYSRDEAKEYIRTGLVRWFE